MQNLIKNNLNKVVLWSLAILAIVLLALAMYIPSANAHVDPVGCTSTGAAISLSVYRADGVTPVSGSGTVSDGEVLKYQATLSWAGGTNCAFEGGTWNLTTPDGVVTNLGAVPQIGGSGVSSITSALVTYTVTHANEVASGGLQRITATTAYTGGNAHDSANDTVGVVSASTGITRTVVHADLHITKTDDVDPIMSGNTLTYTITATNAGDATANSVVVTDTFPTGFTATTVTPSQGSCSSNSPLSCELGSLTSGGSATVTVVGTVSGCSALSNTANVTTTSTEMHGTNPGNTDNSATQTTQVTCGGNIIVDKVTVPSGDTQSFTFVTTGTGYTGFSLTDAGAPNNQSLSAGTYSVSENSVSGWVQTSATCTDGTTTMSPTSITLASGATVTCTFTNTKNGTLIVDKVTNPTGDTTSFSISATGSGTITGGGAGTVTDATNKSYTVAPGTYSVTETVPSGWTQDSNTCSNVTVAAGETKTCTITNTKAPVAGQYCSPGYWKQAQHFDSWMTYSPTDKFSAVFGETITINWSAGGKPAPVTDPTLLQALQANGGGINQLARATVDALLNASALTSGFTPAQVISMFGAAYPGSSTDYSNLAAQFTTAENCPLN